MKFFGNVTKLEAAIEAADSAINPALAKAKILSVKVDGKDVPVSEAPLANRILALLAISEPGSHEQTVAQLTVTNAELASRNEKISGDLATATATLGGVQADLRAMTTRAENAEGSVSTLTAEKGQLAIQLKAAQDEYSRVSREQAAFNTELSKACIAVGCLQLTDANGAALSPNASEAAKLEAANRIPASDKLKAYQAGLNTAIANTGLSVAGLPGAPLKVINTPDTAILAQYDLITDPTERAKFYKANASKIFSAMKALRK